MKLIDLVGKIRRSEQTQDMGERPSGMTLERKNNELGYSKRNCMWATKGQQARNRRNNVWIEHKGERLVAQDWAARLGVPIQTILHRLRLGWSAEAVVTTPVRR